jgi:hypothetical protein
MSKVVETFLADALKHEKVQSAVQQLLTKILEMLTPLLVGVAILWGVMLLGIVGILILLLRKGGGGGGV